MVLIAFALKEKTIEPRQDLQKLKREGLDEPRCFHPAYRHCRNARTCGMLHYCWDGIEKSWDTEAQTSIREYDAADYLEIKKIGRRNM